MKTCGLIGEHLSHSFSALIHSLLADYSYSLIELPPDGVGPFLEARAFDALNVTIPYKKTVMPYCATLSETALAIGSVNTIVKQADGSLYGTNTDAYGLTYLLARAEISLAGKKVILLGSGGSSLTATYVARTLGARSITVISRSGENNYENLDRHRDAEVIINTTPVGMYPHNGSAPITLSDFPHCEAVVDLIYNPARTRLLLDADALGIRHSNGLPMLVAQAKSAAEHFLGKPLPDRATEEVIARVEALMKNIILIGMPGCGKTTVGTLLASLCERELIDTDTLVAARCGMPIPEYLATHTEDEFRTLETEVMREVCRESGKIIATGGGVVTRERNRDLLRQNGTVVFLDRPVEELPCDGRPLSHKHSPAALYRQRIHAYRTWSDLCVKNTTPEEVARAILAALRKDTPS